MDSSAKSSPTLVPGQDQDNIRVILDEYQLELTPDGEFVRWSSSNQKHPRNWPLPRKIFDTSVIVFLDLFTYVSIPQVEGSRNC